MPQTMTVKRAKKVLIEVAETFLEEHLHSTEPLIAAKRDEVLVALITLQRSNINKENP